MRAHPFPESDLFSIVSIPGKGLAYASKEQLNVDNLSPLSFNSTTIPQMGIHFNKINSAATGKWSDSVASKTELDLAPQCFEYQI